MELEEVSIHIDEALIKDERPLEDLWTLLQLKQIADELITRKKRSHTAKIYIRTHERLCQSGKPHTPPYETHKLHHAHLTTHFYSTPHPNPNRVAHLPPLSHKGMSPPLPRAPSHINILYQQNLHTTFYPKPQITPPAARQTPRGRGDGPRRKGKKKLTITPNIYNPRTKEEDKCLLYKTKDKSDHQTITKLIQKFFYIIYHIHPYDVS